MNALLAVSVVLFAVRVYAATTVGFGDSEALYASWAVHPQPAYLDHPGLVGVVARAIGEGASPTPMRAHAVTAIVATLLPWLVYASARAFGATKERAAYAGLAVALVPETAVGLFAMTPDLLLAPLWLGGLALAAIGLEAPAGSTRSSVALLAAGLFAGTACAAKVSGVLLVFALVAAYASIALSKEPEGKAARTVWPWAGIAAGLIVMLPVILYEKKLGWPMLVHRLVDTQHGAGAATVLLRNIGAITLGQLAYLSPVFAVIAVVVARDLIRERGRDARGRLLFLAFTVPLVPLLALCLWSPVAEPHWIAPALLALPIHAARRGAGASRRMYTAAAAVAAALTLGAHAWVLTPQSARLLPETSDPKLDIASELHGWPTALEAVREQMAGAATPFDPEGREVVVVGPHWTVCAQLHAGLPGVRVGCATTIKDDFDAWVPREQWRRADHVLYVTDNRFEGDGGEQLPAHVKSAQSRVRIMRGGRTARVFHLYLYDRRGSGLRDTSDRDAEGRQALHEANENGDRAHEVEHPMPGADGLKHHAVRE
ncbi:MAG: glycosyltransferase family 39 protein [Labilithrix sp.]|nr:glycosyltransferase family 39 protein [Labilithrix sp.]